MKSSWIINGSNGIERSFIFISDSSSHSVCIRYMGLENALNEIEEVSSIQVIDMRRAFG